MATPDSRLPIDRSTNLPSIHTFGELSNFLRHAVADEDSRVFSESMAELALQAEGVIAALRVDRTRAVNAPMLVDMMTVLRNHRSMVLRLNLSWRGLYEYAGYLQALNNFRVLIGQWLQQVDPWDDRLPVTAEDFALVAWRTLGEGMLLVDMYEQWLKCEQTVPGLDLESHDEPRVERVLQWWHKLRR